MKAGKCCAGEDCNFDYEKNENNHHVTYPSGHYKCLLCEKVMHKWCGYIAPDQEDDNVVNCYYIPCKRKTVLRQAMKVEHLCFEYSRQVEAKNNKLLSTSEMEEYFTEHPSCTSPGIDQMGSGDNFEKSVIQVMIKMLKDTPKFRNLRKSVQSSWNTYNIANGKYKVWADVPEDKRGNNKKYKIELRKRKQDMVARRRYLNKTVQNLEDMQRLRKESKTKPPSDAAYNAVIHQHEGIASLLWSTTQSDTDEPDVDIKTKKFFARISKAGCTVLGFRQKTIEVTEDFVNLNFDAFLL